MDVAPAGGGEAGGIEDERRIAGDFKGSLFEVADEIEACGDVADFGLVPGDLAAPVFPNLVPLEIERGEPDVVRGGFVQFRSAVGPVCGNRAGECAGVVEFRRGGGEREDGAGGGDRRIAPDGEADFAEQEHGDGDEGEKSDGHGGRAMVVCAGRTCSKCA